jgi:hypothetical protein
MVHCVGPLCFTKTQQVGSAETQSQNRPHACAGRVPPQESDWSITCRCCGQILSKQSWLWVEDGDQIDASRNLEAPRVLGAGICKHRSCDQGYITVKECGCDATEQVLEFSESCFRKYCSRNPQRSSMVSGELGASMRQRFQPSGVR